MIEFSTDLKSLKEQLARLRGDTAVLPQGSVVIPVNAQKDQTNVFRVLSDVGGYHGKKQLEIILVVNNYPVDNPPREVELYEQIGLRVVAIPYVERKGEIAIAARMHGIRIAQAEVVLLFDADCRIPNSTALINWYLARFEEGCDLAYTHVDFTDLPRDLAVRTRRLLHHASRWFRRSILQMPTSRGSNYAIRKQLILDLFAQGLIPYEIQVGPAVKSRGGKIVYSGARELVVLTSGRTFSQGWKPLISYMIWRLGIYRRILKMKPKKAVPDQ
jgi:hypothetical protein